MSANRPTALAIDPGPTADETRNGYLLGFLLAAALTVVPFWLVMARPLGGGLQTGAVVMALAAVQVVVQMKYFLHVNARAEGGWNLVALVFTVLFVAIVLSGSIWIMYHLNANMMPMSPVDMRQMP
jgi:cytochrome o ubiquinol oxidase operon protein cyoD